MRWTDPNTRPGWPSSPNASSARRYSWPRGANIHGRPRRSLGHWLGTISCLTESHRVSQSLAESRRVLQSLAESHRVSQSLAESRRVSQSLENQRSIKNPVPSQEVPRSAKKCQEVPRGAKKCQEVPKKCQEAPRSAKKCQGWSHVVHCSSAWPRYGGESSDRRTPVTSCQCGDARASRSVL